MRAIRFDRPGYHELVEVPRPDPQPGHVVVAVMASGICGSDLHIYDGQFPPTPFPIIAGHEGAGVIDAVGRDVTRLAAGDRVAIDPSLYCGHCPFCRQNRDNLCDNWASIGGTRNGSFAEYVAIPEGNAYVIPDSMSFAAAAMAEPVSCAVHAIDRLQPRPGERALVYGAGTAGLIIAQLLRAGDTAQVTLLNRSRKRLQNARDLGFSSVGKSLDEIEDPPPGGYDIVVEATGSAAVAEEALNNVRKGGRLLIYGVAPPGRLAAFEPFRIFSDEITILGSMAILASFDRALEALANATVDAARMVTNAFALDDFDQALGAVRNGSGIKNQIAPSR